MFFVMLLMFFVKNMYRKIREMYSKMYCTFDEKGTARQPRQPATGGGFFPIYIHARAYHGDSPTGTARRDRKGGAKSRYLSRYFVNSLLTVYSYFVHNIGLPCW